MWKRSFDLLAPIYETLERLTYGHRLQTCRTALLGELTACEHLLVLGEGDGRFLEAFCRINRVARIDSVDTSAGMLRACRRRLARLPAAHGRVRSLHLDPRDLPIPPQAYDLVVCNFFLDCFPPHDIEAILHHLKACTHPGSLLLVGDFALPPKPGPVRWLSRPALAIMYAFFGAMTRLPARQLADLPALLRAQGYQLLREHTQMRGFLSSTLWCQQASPNGEGATIGPAILTPALPES